MFYTLLKFIRTSVNTKALTFVAFVKERFEFIMQSKSTFLEFLRGIHRYKFAPPQKNFSGAKLFRANDVIYIKHVLCS